MRGSSVIGKSSQSPSDKTRPTLPHQRTSLYCLINFCNGNKKKAVHLACTRTQVSVVFGQNYLMQQSAETPTILLRDQALDTFATGIFTVPQQLRSPDIDA